MMHLHGHRDGAPAAGGAVRCSHCGDIIGVYEPMLIVPHEGIPILTSLTATPDAERRGMLLHDYCER